MGRSAKRQIYGFFIPSLWGIKALPNSPFLDENRVMMLKRLSALLIAPLMLGGCVTAEYIGDNVAATVGLADEAPRSYTSSEVSEAARLGVVVSDEPLAARAGAAVLTAQGSAVDAVATMFFTLAVTYPAAAGLGSGGICLVRDASGRVTEFNFLTRAPARGGAYAVPGGVRAFADMQRLHGALPWQRVVAPGEAYAATGFPISQALSARLAAAQNVVRLDADLAAEFLDESGQPRAVGSEVRNPALGLTLGQIRISGADGFYKGATAARIETYSAAQGGAVTLDELAAVTTQQSPARSRNTGDLIIHLPGARTGAGVFTNSLFDNLARQGGGGEAGIAAAVRQSLASFGVASLPRDLGSTGFAAVDVTGQAASCAITLNGPFGSGRTAAGTGVVLAASPSGPAGLASAFLTPLIATGGDNQVLASTGAGGPNGTAAAVHALLEVTRGRPLGKRGDLRSTGAAPFDTVNVISCNSEACVALSDPGAHGLGTAADPVAASVLQ
jgi:gamma-glutamyltranspeptidase/glutathione hydrolase